MSFRTFSLSETSSLEDLTLDVTPPPKVYEQTSSSTEDSDLPNALFSKKSSNSTDLESALSPLTFKINEYVPSPEHFRDITWAGPITFHRIFVIIWVAASLAAQYFFQEFLTPDRDELSTNQAISVWLILGFIWLIPFPSALAYVFGSLWFRYPSKLDKVKPTIDYNVAFRIVSRGINNGCLLATIRRVQSEMRLSPMFPYIIEVLTDGDAFQAPDDDDVIHLRVPPSYQTEKGSRFKARALHYACESSTVPPDTWVVHLDEESHPTSSGIKGIAAMITECELSGNVRRVGQGAILYHRGWKKHPLLTLADMRRTGDDLGHFFFQHRIGRTIFGLHGSYVVCRQDVEASIGFDLGPNGSITEDAWWVLLAMGQGIRTKWVEGYVEEQSTQGLMDFLKQRRRWYIGLFKTSLLAPAKLRYKVFLMWNTATWIMIPILVPLTFVTAVFNFRQENAVLLPIRLLSSVVFSASTLVYLNGIIPNMREHGTPWWRVPFWVVLMIVLMPVFFVLEFAGVLYAVVSPFMAGTSGFHVVKKSEQ